MHFSENSFFCDNFVGPSYFSKSISAIVTKFGTKIVYVIVMANRGNELAIRNFELDLTSTPWAKKMINLHLFQIAVYSTLFVTGFQ